MPFAKKQPGWLRNELQLLFATGSGLRGSLLVASIIGVITFVCSLAGSVLARATNIEAHPQLQSQANETDRTKLNFKIGKASHITTSEGFLSTTLRIIASDGTVLTEYFVDYNSSTRAERDAKQWAMSAAKVLRTSPVLNEHGETVGRKVLAVFSEKGSDKPIYKLIWTYEARFRAITCYSMDVLEQFEHQELVPTQKE